MSLIEGFDPFKVIKRALRGSSGFSELYIEDSTSTSIIVEDDKVEKVLAGRDRGAGLRLITEDGRTYYAYTNEVSESGLTALAETVSSAVMGAVKGGESTGNDISLIKKDISKGFGIRVNPKDVSLNEKIDFVNRGNTTARKLDKRIRQVKVVYGDAAKETAIINSLGEWVEEAKSSVLYLAQVVAAEGDVIQTGYEPLGGLLGIEIFDEKSPEEVAELAAKRAVMMLGARKARGGSMGVILSSEAGGTMIHEAVGHGLEADLAGEGLSVYKGKLGERVASELITVVDDGTIPNKRGSGFFDGEGSPTQRTLLVEDGILKTYMYDRLTAKKAGVSSTGNGRRESYRFRPIPRMTNMMIMPGKSSVEDVVRSLDSGLFVKRMGGGQVNTVNGDFVFEVTEGYMIEDGEIGEPVRGATLTGNGPKVLMEIDMVATDLGFGIGTCGKDGQGVPVADAQPTLRIPEIVVGGETKGK